MQITGDESGISALKELSKDNKSYIKFLIAEAGSNSDRTAQFKAPDGTLYLLRLEGDNLVVAPAG